MRHLGSPKDIGTFIIISSPEATSKASGELIIIKDIGTFIIISSPDAFDVAWEADVRTTDLVNT